MFVRISYDPDLSRTGATVEVDRVTGKQMIRNGRAVEVPDPAPVEPEASEPVAPKKRARKRADG